MSKQHPEETIRPDLNEFGGPRSLRSVLTDKRGLSTSVPEALGAIGLGIFVIGVGAVGLGAAWNFGQDSGAQTALEGVKGAQVLYQSKNSAFGDVAALTTGQDPALKNAPTSLAIAATDKNYCAAVKSSGMFSPSYWITAKSGKVLNTKPDAATAGVTCPDPA